MFVMSQDGRVMVDTTGKMLSVSQIGDPCQQARIVVRDSCSYGESGVVLGKFLTPERAEAVLDTMYRYYDNCVATFRIPKDGG